ncbi:MAG: CAP domain-containing protein, partial [Pseudomonas capeferrum]
MRVLSSVAALSLGLVISTGAFAVTGEEGQLIDSINAYRSKAQPCGGEASLELPPLNSDTRLALSPEGTRDLQQAMTRAAYPMVNVQAISLSGPRDAQAAMHAIEESFCQVVLDPQFVDIGVSQEGRDWRIVLARPLL